MTIAGGVGQFARSKSNDRLIFAYKAGEIFPLKPIELSSSTGRTYIYKALNSVKLHRITNSQFKSMLKQQDNTIKFLKYALHIIQQQTERIDNLQEEQIVQRLLERLVYIANRFGIQDGDSFIISIPMSHVDLATSINTTRETVNRHMKNFEKLGILSLRKKIIRIKSIQQVRDMLTALNKQ